MDTNAEQTVFSVTSNSCVFSVSSLSEISKIFLKHFTTAAIVSLVNKIKARPNTSNEMIAFMLNDV